MKYLLASCVTIFFLAFLLPPSLISIGAEDTDKYRQIDGPCGFRFPGDHGPHNDFRTEWWYYTGNVTDPEGQSFGFQLTFFRSKISPTDRQLPSGTKKSPWRTDQIILAHAALSDISRKRHFQDEKISRKALDIADARENDGITRIHISDWRLLLTPERHILRASTKSFSYSLSLIPQKPPVAHGNQGYSRKGEKRISASCYYSFTRLAVEGIIDYDGKKHAVKGLGWMDHEYSSAPLEDNLTGWDWFSVQLDNGSELMLYLLRHDDGSFSSASSGTFVDPSGEGHHLPLDEFSISVLDYWKSDRSDARYPSRWRIRVLRLNAMLEVAANFENQEMNTPRSTGVTYWEGSVSVTGTMSGNRVSGMGYVELTGYAKKFDAPM